jgi:hypothetical protein
MDRDELQDRIRARRSGGEPYRRGYVAEEGGYERFRPEPEDARARRDAPQHEQRPDFFDDRAPAPSPPPAVDRRDLTRETDDWTAPAPPPSADPAMTADAVPAADDRVAVAYPAGAEPRDDYDAYDDDAVGYPYEYDTWEDRREQRSGAGAFAIIGFLALGVLALLGGAVLAGVFSDGGDPISQVSPTPAVLESVAPSPSVAPSVAPSVVPSADASAAPPASGEPIVFPDGFVAEAQPCIPGSVRPDGCNSSGAVNGGQVEIWVGFQNGTASDVIGAEIVAPDGTTVGEGTIPLANIDCGSSCNGHTWFSFGNLEPGQYEVRVTRNGEPASSTGFEVT